MLVCNNTQIRISPFCENVIPLYDVMLPVAICMKYVMLVSTERADHREVTNGRPPPPPHTPSMFNWSNVELRVSSFIDVKKSTLLLYNISMQCLASITS